jgi:stage II sporulation protein D
VKRQTVPALLISLCAVLLTAPVGGRGQTARAVAWRLIDVASGQTVDGSTPSSIDVPSLPGSVLNLPTLIAALESGAIKPDTRFACPGFAEVDGRRIACAHPRIRRPLSAAEALAYSCNHYFAEVGARLSRERLNAVLASLGLPAAKPATPLGLAAIGVDAAPVAPSALLRAFVRIVAGPNALPLRPATRSVVVEGLRGAALFGTAAGFGGRGIQALAKTGTAASSGSGQQGVVVAMWPADAPQRAAVVVVSGGSGPDAALVAADIARTGRPAAAPVAPLATAASSVPAPAVAAPSPASVPSSVMDEPTQIRVGFSQGRSAYSARALPLEDYVARVLAGEAAARSRPAALEALAITVRTFALANRNRHGKDGFDLCTTTHCQVLREPTAATRAAAASTAGLVLAWHGQPASVYYTASCGGRTERPSNVWPGAEDPPFMPSQPDAACAGQPRWVTEIPAADLVRALRSAGFSGVQLRDVRIVSRNESGRVNQLEVRGLTPAQISGQALRVAVGRELGWQLLKSTSFDVIRSGPGYRFTGRGYGHGVGFCVIGATNRADTGASRADILAAYFPGLQVTAASRLKPVDQVTAARAAARPALGSGDAADDDAEADTSATPPAPVAVASTAVTSPPGIVLRLPEADERAREWIQSLAGRALDAAASRSGRPVPQAIEIVFYASQDAFTRATREPWWTPALTRGARIELQPVTALRQRSLLERTLAHEIAHIVTAPGLVGRPEWVKEGAAMFASGEITEAQIAARARAKPGVGCPSDPEVRRAVSAAAARDAYMRAGECFAWALGQGRRWDDIR